MTVATALAVSWKPLTNSNASAISSATPSSKNAPVANGGPPADEMSDMRPWTV